MLFVGTPRPLPRLARTALGGGALVVAMLVTPTVATSTPASAAASAPTTSRISSRCLSPKPNTKRPTRFGINLNPSPMLSDDLETEQARFGHLSIVRTYDDGIPPWNAWEIRAPQLKRRTIVTSIKVPPAEVLAGKYDKDFRHYFRTAPRKPKIYWAYFHEPEQEVKAGDFTTRQYRRAWRHIARIAGKFCRPNLYPTLILTGWTADPASDWNWRDYYPGKRFISVIAWDPYNQAVGTPSSYRRPADVYGAVVRASRRSGKPWAIAETGTARTAADRSGEGRARWIRKMGRYLKRKHPMWVIYFQSTRNGDFELRDAPSVKAYRHVIHS
jgi:hypothetical protein